jgi:hypothetical protein
MDAKPYKPAVRELAARIYTELICVGAKSDAAAATATAQGVARLSFQLADAFQAVEDQLDSANHGKTAGYKLEGSDIAGWTK